MAVFGTLSKLYRSTYLYVAENEKTLVNDPLGFSNSMVSPAASGAV